MHAWKGVLPVEGTAFGATVQSACAQAVSEQCCRMVLDLSSLPAGDMNVAPREGSFTLPKVPGAYQSAPSNGRPQPIPQPPPQASTSGSAWAWPSMLPAFASGPGAGQPCSACHVSSIKGKSGLLMLVLDWPSMLPAFVSELAQVRAVLFQMFTIQRAGQHRLPAPLHLTQHNEQVGPLCGCCMAPHVVLQCLHVLRCRCWLAANSEWHHRPSTGGLGSQPTGAWRASGSTTDRRVKNGAGGTALPILAW